MNLLKKIGSFFKGLFNASEKAYNKLDPEQQEALKNGSGLVAIINQHLKSTPAEVREAILSKYPNLSIEALEGAMFKIAQAFNLTSLNSLDDAIVRIQKHLLSLEKKDWALASHLAASALSILFAPPATKVAAIVSLIEFVYQRFFKKAI